MVIYKYTEVCTGHMYIFSYITETKGEHLCKANVATGNFILGKGHK